MNLVLPAAALIVYATCGFVSQASRFGEPRASSSLSSLKNSPNVGVNIPRNVAEMMARS
jgi:hypothetical protein